MFSPGFEQALEMIQGLKDELHFSSLYGLSNLAREEIERLGEVWPSIEVGQRRRVLEALIEVLESSSLVDFSAVFRLCLEDEDASVRALAIEGLWEERDWSLASLFLRLLREDPAVEVRAAAAMALGSFVLEGELKDQARARAARVREALIEVLRASHEPMEVRRRALESVAYASDERVSAFIEVAYYDDEAKMRASALLAMGRSADPRWASMVLQELRSSDPEMRYEAALACGELQLAQAVHILRDLAQDSDREVQETAIWALGQIGGSEARRILEACYEEGDEFICEAVEEALDNLQLIDDSFNLAYHQLMDEDLQDLDDLRRSPFYRRQGTS